MYGVTSVAVQVRPATVSRPAPAASLEPQEVNAVVVDEAITTGGTLRAPGSLYSLRGENADGSRNLDCPICLDDVLSERANDGQMGVPVWVGTGGDVVRSLRGYCFACIWKVLETHKATIDYEELDQYCNTTEDGNKYTDKDESGDIKYLYPRCPVTSMTFNGIQRVGTGTRVLELVNMDSLKRTQWYKINRVVNLAQHRGAVLTGGAVGDTTSAGDVQENEIISLDSGSDPSHQPVRIYRSRFGAAGSDSSTLAQVMRESAAAAEAAEVVSV